MRSKNAFNNLITSLGYELFVFALGLIVPRFIILSYGDSINGLTQTINRLLSLVHLIQAGAVGTSIYEMYKPVANKDYETQSSIMYASRRFFHTTGYIYLSIAMVCAVFYGFYLQDNVLDVWEIILSFAILAINGALYFFYTTKHDIVCSTYQKKYLMTRANFAERIIYYALLFGCIQLNLHFTFMYLALLIGGIIRVLINEKSYRKITAGNIAKNPVNKNYKIRDRKYLMMSSIGSEMMTAAPTVIITTFVGLAQSSVFSIYAMVYTSMKMIVNSLHLAVSAIFGNLVASSDDSKIANVFNVLVYIFVIIGALLTSCTAFLFMPFINLYTAGFDGVNYVYPILAIFITAYVGIFTIKIVYSFVATVYGLFKLTCKITLTYGVIGVVVSAVCVVMFGMPYVMVGVLLFHLLSMVALLIAFKREIAWIKFDKLILRVSLIVILAVLSYLLYAANIISITSWIGWFVTAAIYAAVICVILMIYTAVFERKEFVELFKYAKAIFRKK